jgi:hypothetical protein
MRFFVNRFLFLPLRAWRLCGKLVGALRGKTDSRKGAKPAKEEVRSPTSVFFIAVDQ